MPSKQTLPSTQAADLLTTEGCAQGLQQFCGVNVMAYYSTYILGQTGFRRKTAQKLSAGFGAINFVFAIPAIPLIDKVGRRGLLLWTFPFMAIFQLMAGLAYVGCEDVTCHSEAKKILVVVGMYLFSVAYSPGEGPVPFVYASESIPLYVRDLGMAHATAVNWFFNFLLAITFPPMFKSFGKLGAFTYYAAWCVVGWVLILLFVYETKNQTLEELDARFSIPTREHAKQAIRTFKYNIQRYGLRRRHLKKPVLEMKIRDPSGAEPKSEEDDLRMMPLDSVYWRQRMQSHV